MFAGTDSLPSYSGFRRTHKQRQLSLHQRTMDGLALQAAHSSVVSR